MRYTTNNDSIPSFRTMVDDFFNTSLGDILDYNNINQANANIKEEDNKYTFELKVPGINKKDLKLNIIKGKLNVMADLEPEASKTKTSYFIKEFKINSFNRSFKLPENIIIDKIEANYELGILSISLPKDSKKEEFYNKTIEIK